MPPAVVPGEGVHLVDDDGADTSEQQGMVGREADKHRLQRFRRGQQDVRRIEPDPPALGLASVTVPELRTAAQPLCILVDPGSEVVQQCLQRAQVEHRHSGPALLDHGGEDRERGRLGFAAAVGASSSASSPSSSGSTACSVAAHAGPASLGC